MDSTSRFVGVEELLVHLATWIQDYTTFHALCLTTRAFHRIFTPFLWSEIVWNKNNDVFFYDKKKIDMLLESNREKLPEIRTMRALRPDPIEIGISNIQGGLGVPETVLLVKNMPNLETYE